MRHWISEHDQRRVDARTRIATRRPRALMAQVTTIVYLFASSVVIITIVTINTTTAMISVIVVTRSIVVIPVREIERRRKHAVSIRCNLDRTNWKYGLRRDS